MKEQHIGNIISQKRKQLGYTQQNLADYLNISFQAVSKWETGGATPDISSLPKIAHFLETSVDVLLGYTASSCTDYEARYKDENYYWGLNPNHLCYEIMKLKPPTKPYRVLDIGCGEGKDAIFLAKNGYIVSAFDVADSGLEKGRKLAEQNKVSVNFFKADLFDYKSDTTFDIIYSSGVLHYLTPETRKDFINNLKIHTSINGIHVLNVFVKKPFIQDAVDSEKKELENAPWYSGELFTYYHDWLFHTCKEEIFDCNSGGIPHKHCMDTLIAEYR